jgi:hypothetical protein
MGAFEQTWAFIKFDDESPTPYLSNSCKRCEEQYPLMHDPDIPPSSPDFPIHEHLATSMCKKCRHDKLSELKWTHENHPAPDVIGLDDRRMLNHLVDIGKLKDGQESTQNELDFLNTPCMMSQTRYENDREDSSRAWMKPLPPCTCGGCPPLRWYERMQGIPEGME